MAKINWKKVRKRVFIFLIINFILYIAACFVLIYWPLPKKKDVKNYDFSSIKKKTHNAAHGTANWVKLRDDKNLFCRIYDSESKAVMILIHGSGSESRYLSSLADSLAKAKIATVLTPDLRGHGKSEGKRGDIDYMGQLEDDIEDIIEYSRKNLGAQKIILAGHSSGGGFVLRFIANRQSAKVDKAILIAPYLGHNAPTTKPNSGNWVTVAIKRWVGLSMFNNIGIHKFDHLPVLFFNRPETINDKLQLPSYSYRMAVNFAPRSYKSDIAKIGMPCLVLVGQKDESFYPEKFKEVFEPAEKFVKTEVLPDVNHIGIVSNPAVIEHIIKWMPN